MSAKILVVEDDESIRRLLEVTLKSQGYEPAGFADGASALEWMGENVPDAAILDIMMEGIDGVTTLRLMRENPRLSAVPAIMLTAKDTETDKVIGLDAGADDYMTKPFSVIELCARVRAQLRRAASGAAGSPDADCYEGGGLLLNIATREVSRDGAPVELALKEFELLRLLMERAGRVVPRAELLEQVWGGDYFGETRTLDIHIGTLRQKLGDSADNSRFIRTVRGVGYRFVGGLTS